MKLTPYNPRKSWPRKLHSFRPIKPIRAHINPNFCQVSKYQFNLLLTFQYAYKLFSFKQGYRRAINFIYIIDIQDTAAREVNLHIIMHNARFCDTTSDKPVKTTHSVKLQYRYVPSPDFIILTHINTLYADAIKKRIRLLPQTLQEVSVKTFGAEKFCNSAHEHIHP
ncbi:hypothetical protein AO261_10730 [Pseudomonas avellanae]|nr:hypothetical protein AO261_10730 [Pseudomonas avellanae]